MKTLARRIAPLAAAALVAPTLFGSFTASATTSVHGAPQDVVDACDVVSETSVPDECDDAVIAEVESTADPILDLAETAEKPVVAIEDAPPVTVNDGGKVTTTFEVHVAGEIQDELEIEFGVSSIGEAEVNSDESVTFDPTTGGESLQKETVEVEVTLQESVEDLAPGIADVVVVELFPADDKSLPTSNDPENVTLAKRHGIGPVVSDVTAVDATPQVVVSDAAATRIEGGGSPPDASFVIAMVPPQGEGVEVEVSYKTAALDEPSAAAQPAEEGVDYTLTDGTVTFGDGETVKPVSVEVPAVGAQDGRPPVVEFGIDITDVVAGDAEIARARGIGRIVTVPDAESEVDALKEERVDPVVDSTTPVVTVGPAVAVRPADSVDPAEELVFLVTAVGDAEGVTIGYETVEPEEPGPLDAEEGVHYTGVDDSLTFTPEHVLGGAEDEDVAYQAEIPVPVLPGEAEISEVVRTVTLSVNHDGEGVEIADHTAVGVIVSDPIAAATSLIRELLFTGLETAGEQPTVTIEADSEVLEPATDGEVVEVDVTVTGPRAVPVFVDWTTAEGPEDGGATAGTDYGAEGEAIEVTGRLEFPTGTEDETLPIEVPLLANDTADGDRVFTVEIEADGASVADDGETQLTIIDDDTITISIGDAEVDEPTTEAQTTLGVAVTLDPPQYSRTIEVPYSTQDGSAKAGTHYVAAGDNDHLTFEPDDSSQSISLTILNDETFEDDATLSFSVDLGEIDVTGGAGADITVTGDPATVTITDKHDAPTVTLDHVVGSNEVVFTATRTLAAGTSQTSVDTTFDYETVSGTAVAGPKDDYTSVDGSATIPADAEDPSHDIEVPVKDGGSGTFSLRLYNLAGANDTELLETVDLGNRSPGHIVALTEADEDGPRRLVSFNPETPTAAADHGPIEGVDGSDELLAIEFDGDGNLYALARNSSDSTPRLYKLEYDLNEEPDETEEVVATRETLLPCIPVMGEDQCLDDLLPAPALDGDAYDLAWVPAAEDAENRRVFRVAGDNGQHLVVDVDGYGDLDLDLNSDGDGDVRIRITLGLPFRYEDDPAGTAPALAGIAYSPTFVDPDGAHPRLFGIDIDVATRSLVYEPGEFTPPVDPNQVVEDIQELVPDVPPEGVPPEGVPPEPPASASSHEDPTAVADDPTTAPNLLASGAVQDLGLLGVPSGVSDHGPRVGFDVGHDGVAYLAASDGVGRTKLYTVDLDTASGTEPRASGGAFIASPGVVVSDLAVQPTGVVEFVGDMEEDEPSIPIEFAAEVQRLHGTVGDVTVDYELVDDFDPDDHTRAVEGEDFELTEGQLTFAPGEATKGIPFTLLPNDDFDGDRQFALDLVNPSPTVGLGEKSRVVVTITDGEPGTVSITGLNDDDVAFVDEGDSTDSITLTRSDGTEGILEVDFETYVPDDPDSEGREPADEGATSADGDYVPITKTFTFDKGESGSQTIDVVTHDDDRVEADEIVGLRLTGARVVDDDGTVLDDSDDLLDTDEGTLVVREVEPGQVQFSAATLEIEESEDEDPVTVSVSRTGGGSGEITVGWQAHDGTGDDRAVAGTDYGTEGSSTAPSGEETLGHGDDEASFDIKIHDNDDFDGDRNFTVTLETAGHAPVEDGRETVDRESFVGAPDEVEITILDDDIHKTGGEFAVADDAIDVREDGTLEVPVVRTLAGSGAVRLSWTASDDTAEAGSDYGSPEDEGAGESLGTLVVESGETEATLIVPVIDDDDVEGPESFTVELTGTAFLGEDEPDVGPQIGSPDETTATILDIEPGLAYGVADGNTLVAFNPVLPNRSDDAADVIGPITGLRDREIVEGLTFGPSGSRLYALAIKDGQEARIYSLEWSEGDAVATPFTEPFEISTADAFGVTFDAAGNFLLATTAGELVVVSAPDEVENKPLDHADSTETPQIGALTTGVDGTVYGIDTSENDLVRLGGVGGVEPAPTSAQVTKIADLDIGPDVPTALGVTSDMVGYLLTGGEDVYRVFLESEGDDPAGSTRSLATLDDDSVGASGFTSLAIAASGVLDLDADDTADESAGRVEVDVLRTRGTFGEVGAGYEVLDGSGSMIDSGSVSLDAGQASATIEHPWNPSEIYDDPREITVRLVQPTGGAALGDERQATVTVVHDGPPTVSVGSDVRVVERGDGATARVQVRLQGATNKTATVAARTVNGSARARRDYTPVKTTVQFPAGVTTRTVEVPIKALGKEPPDRRFDLVLSDPVDASLGGDARATIRIVRDYPAPPPPEREQAPQVEGVTIEEGPVNSQSTPDGRGYWIATPEGDVFGFGNAERFGSLRGAVATAQVGAPVVELVVTPEGDGYWLLDDQGGVHTFGDARFFGSLPGRVQRGLVGPAEVTGMARTPSGNGYVILDEQGGIHTFGDATFHGSIPARRAAGVPVGFARATSISVTPSGHGYVVLDEQGGVHTFGDATFLGSIPGLRASGVPVGQTRFVGLATTPDGRGYWILDQQGGVHTFGNARFHGSIPGLKQAGQNIGNARTTSIEPAPGGAGYWIFDEVGGVFTFGDARFAGSVPGRLRG